MKTAALFLFLVSIAYAEVYAPKSHPVIPQLALTDGRILKDAKILSDTAYTVTVAAGGKILPVDKKLLPADLLAQWPIDEVRAANDRAVEKAALAKREAATAKLRAAEEQARQSHIKDAMAAAEKSKASDEAREAAFQKTQAELRASHDGLLIEGVGSSFGKIYILLKNVSGGIQTFNWHDIRLIPYKIDEEFPLAGVATQPEDVEELTLRPQQRRVFRMLQTTQLEVKEIHWKDDPTKIPVKQLYRQRSQVAMGDQYAKQRREEHAAYVAGVETDDEVTKILLAATRPHVGYELRK